jgi:predicted RNA-binding protein with PUA-like domain
MPKPARQYWLMKSEPDEFSIDDLERVGTEPWSGVRNYQARNYMMKDMKVGDGILFYHSNCAVPGVAGLAEVASTTYPDPTQFQPKSDYFDAASKPEEPRRTLKKVDLMEVSLVTFPANGTARVASVKSGADFSDREFEQLMQDAGLSRKEARVVMSHGFRHLKAMQDAGSGELDELAAAIKRNTSLIQTT